jgi:hypothetical protein
MTPAKNQDFLGTCTSFAVGACVEYHNMRNHLGRWFYTPVSEAEFTVYAEQHTPGGDCKQGLNLGEALVVAKDRGFIREDLWPYTDYESQILRTYNAKITDPDFNEKLEDANICMRGKYSSTMLEQFPKYQLNDIAVIHHKPRIEVSGSIATEVHRLSSVSSGYPIPMTPSESDIVPIVKAYIHNRQAPVAVSVATFGLWDMNTNLIPMPDFGTLKEWSYPTVTAMIKPKLVATRWGYTVRDTIYREKNPPKMTEDPGWHAIVLTGYNDKSKMFTFKNSWGPRFGTKGFGQIPYDYIRSFASEVVATL